MAEINVKHKSDKSGLIDKSKIALITTVCNFDLYKQTLKSFPSGIEIFYLDGTGGFYGIQSLLFFIEKIKKFNIDWIIMADEDVVFTKPDAVFELIDYMAEEGFTACGMRDGGTLGWRNNNPYAINTFFSVLNLKEVYPIYNRKEILANQYMKYNENLGPLVDIRTNNYQVNSLIEPYYCFYFWLLRNNKKILYLDATGPNKDETTLVFDHRGKELLFHAWYSRLYNREQYHTQRINTVLKYGAYNEEKRNPILLKNPLFWLKRFFYKYI